MENERPSDDLFNNRFQTARVYNPARLSRTRLILTSLEESFDTKERVAMTDGITIEHLMPQTLNDEWREELGSEYREVHEELLHTIGNLTYSGYNAEMGNLAFSEKKQKLGSKFEMNKSALDQESWGREQIEERARDLAVRAVKIWAD
jgi:hypothetical protein